LAKKTKIILILVLTLIEPMLESHASDSKQSTQFKQRTMAMNGTITGTDTSRGLGTIPIVSLPGGKPQFRNNGCNVFAGQGPVEVEGLESELRKQSEHGSPQGWVKLLYECGQHAFLFASHQRGSTFNFR
jgi:hypothetical protein